MHSTCLFSICILLSVLGASSAPKGKGSLKRRLERAVNPEGGAPSEVSTGDAEIPIPDVARRTSVNRRLAKAEGDVQGAAEKPFEEEILNRWDRGRMSSLDVQKIALGAPSQGMPRSEALASAGSSGAHPQNAQRSLVNHSKTPAGTPDMR